MKISNLFMALLLINCLISLQILNLNANVKTFANCLLTPTKIYNWNGNLKDSKNTFIGFSLKNKSNDAIWLKVSNSTISNGEPKISPDLKNKVGNGYFEDVLAAKNGYTNIELDTSKPTKIMIYKLVIGTNDKQLLGSFNLNLKQEPNNINKTIYLTWGPLDANRAANVQKLTNQNGPNFLYPETGSGLRDKVSPVCNTLKNNTTLEQLNDPCSGKSINERCQIKQNNLIYEGFCAPIGTLSTGALTCKSRKTEQPTLPKSWQEEFRLLLLKAFPMSLPNAQDYLRVNLTSTDNFKKLNDFLDKTIFRYIDNNINSNIDGNRQELFQIYSDFIKEFKDINSKWSSVKAGPPGNLQKFKLNHGLGLKKLSEQLDGLKSKLSALKGQQRNNQAKEFIDKLWIVADGLKNVVVILANQLRNS